MAYEQRAANRIHRAETSSPRDRASTVQQIAPTTATATQTTRDPAVDVGSVGCGEVTTDMGILPAISGAGTTTQLVQVHRAMKCRSSGRPTDAGFLRSRRVPGQAPRPGAGGATPQSR